MPRPLVTVNYTDLAKPRPAPHQLRLGAYVRTSATSSHPGLAGRVFGLAGLAEAPEQLSVTLRVDSVSITDPALERGGWQRADIEARRQLAARAEFETARRYRRPAR